MNPLMNPLLKRGTSSSMHRQQRGMTMIGMIIAFAFGGMFLLAGMKIGPVYLEHMKVKSAIEKVASELSGNNPSVADVKNALAKRYNVEGISHPDYEDIKVRKEGAGIRIEAKYDHVVSYIGNVHFLVAFDEYVDVKR